MIIDAEEEVQLKNGISVAFMTVVSSHANEK